MGTILDFTSFEARLMQIIEDLLRPYPEGAARIEYSLRSSDESFITVLPGNSDAAALHLHLDRKGGYVDFSFGNCNSTMELDGQNLLERVRDFSEAVFLGRCGEIGGLMARTSWIEPVGRTDRVRSSTLFYPRLFKREVRFSPYSA